MTTVTHNYYHGGDQQTLELVEVLLTIIYQTLKQRNFQMDQEIDSLLAQVERNDTVDGSLKTLFLGIAAELETHKNNATRIQQIADRLKSQNDSVADFVLANTPAAEPTPPVEEPTPQPPVDANGNPV